MPCPVSEMAISTASAVLTVRTLRSPPSGIASNAFVMILVMARRTRRNAAYIRDNLLALAR